MVIANAVEFGFKSKTSFGFLSPNYMGSFTVLDCNRVFGETNLNLLGVVLFGRYLVHKLF